MNNEEKNFDDLLRSKLTEREFFFDELNWDKAEQKIIQEERNRKMRRVALIFLGGFIAGAAIMFPLAALLTSNTKQKAVVATNTPVAINDTKTLTSANNSATAPIASASNNATQIQGPATTTPSEPGDKNNIAVSDKVPSKDKKHAKNKKASAADNAETYAYVRPASERKHKKAMANPALDDEYDKHMARVANANNSASTNNNQNRVAANNAPANNAASNSSNQNQAAANNATPKNNADKNTTVAANNTPANTNTQQNSSANNASQINSNTPANNSTPSTDKNNNTQTNNNTTPTDKNNSAQANSSNTPTQPKADSNKLQAKASVNNPSQNKDFVSQDNKPVSATKPPFKPSTSLSIDAGAGYSLGWKDEGTMSGNGISPVIGLRLNHSFSQKISLGVGVRYYGLTHLNSPYSSTLVSYNFGYNSSVVTVSPQMLHYIALPLEFQYNINKNSMVSLGATLLYLLNTTSTVTTYTQNGIEAPSSQKKTAWGYTDGFNQFDGQMVIAYRRKLFGSFGASAEAYYGLLDVESNSFFLINSFERNSGLRLILSYTIGK